MLTVILLGYEYTFHYSFYLYCKLLFVCIVYIIYLCYIKVIKIMKTQDFIPSQRVIDQVNAIVKLNRDHNAAIRGLSINLFFGDRFTKEECKYMESEVRRIEYENSDSYFGTCLHG